MFSSCVLRAFFVGVGIYGVWSSMCMLHGEHSATVLYRMRNVFGMDIMCGNRDGNVIKS